MNKRKLLNYLGGVFLLALTACSSGSANSGQSQSNPTKVKGIEISTPTTVPVFANTVTTAGLWLHNVNGENLSRIYVTSSNVVNNKTSTVKKVVRSALSSLPNSLLRTLGITNPNYYTSDYFILDENSVASCSSELSKGKGSQCYLKFQTPLVQDPSDNDYVILHVVDNKGVDNQQIINWSVIASASNIKSGAYQTALTGSVRSGTHVTSYIYMGGQTPYTTAVLNVGVTPAGSAIIVNGYAKGVQVTPGAIVAVEALVTTNQASTKTGISSLSSIGMTSSLSFSNGLNSSSSVMEMSIAPQNVANLVTSNLPVLQVLPANQPVDGQVIEVLNNGTMDATSVTVSSSITGVATASIGSCGTIVAGATCMIVITPVTTGVSNITISYNSGATAYTLPTIVAQVVDARPTGALVSVVSPGATVIAGHSGTAQAGESAVLTFSIFNSSTAPEPATNLAVTQSINQGTNSSAVIASNSISNSCPTTLVPGANCSVTVSVNSLESLPAVAYAGIVYSFNPSTIVSSVPTVKDIALVSVTILGDPTLTPSQPSVTMVALGNGVAESRFTMILANTGSESALVKSSFFSTTQPESTLSVVASGTTCLPSFVLVANGGTCTIEFQIGPKFESENESGIANYVVNYINGSIAGRSFSTNFNLYWNMTASNVDMTLSNVAVTAGALLSGVGTVASPFVVKAGAMPQITLTYLNTSTDVALENQAIDLSSLPPYLQADSFSTCGTAAFGAKTILPGASCDLVLDFMGTATSLSSLANNAGLLTFNFMIPAASWQESALNKLSSESVFSWSGGANVYVNYQMATLTSSLMVSGTTAVVTQTLANDNSSYPSFSNVSTFTSSLSNFMIESYGSCGYTISESDPIVTCPMSSSVQQHSWSVVAGPSIAHSSDLAGMSLLFINSYNSIMPVVLVPKYVQITGFSN